MARTKKDHSRYAVDEGLVETQEPGFERPVFRRPGFNGVVAFDDMEKTNAVAVAEKHGIGKRSLSNFDCFHYAYAKVADVPLLTLDLKLRETDIKALP